MLYLRTEMLSHYNIFTPSNNNNNNNNRLFSSNEPNTALIRWLFHTTLFPGIIIFMAIYLQNNTASSPLSNTSKWIQSCSSVLHSCSSVLASAIATYLTLMVIIECTVLVLLSQAGIDRAIDPSTVSSAYQQQGKHSAALDRCIERSLLQRDIEDTETETGVASTSGSSCCGEQQDSSHATETATATATQATTLSGANNSCAICLEDFRPEDTVVSGRRDCCKSNVFHESCIKQWLRIKDSCPCCRQAMLEGPIETDDDTGQRETERDTERDARASRYESATTITFTSASRDGVDNERPSFRSQFRIKIDTVARMRNEILSYYVEGTETIAAATATTTTEHGT